MQKRQALFTIISILALLFHNTFAQEAAKKEKNKASAPQAAGNPVTGSGTPGQLTKWTGVDGSNTYTVGDSSITEDKFGNVGVGTKLPTSRLTVAGIIQSSIGGFKFPDGTIQTTSGIANVTHDATLTGNGTTAAPLGVAVPLALSGAVGLSDAVIKASNTGTGAGLFGESTNGPGVLGKSTNSDALNGQSESGRGVVGASTNNHGVLAVTGSTGSSAGGLVAMGSGSATGGIAGIFSGKVEINAFGTQPGDLTVAGKLMVTSGMKMFHIDHPLDPENKYLNHAAIESSEVLNVYSGNSTTDQNGEAVVELPDWFEALNKDFRYQLTVVGQFAQAIVARKIKGNRFAIKTNAPDVEVSWQVTGVRSDPTARKFKFEIEEEKGEVERGYYLNPDAFGQPEEKSIQWARDPEGMKLLKQRRVEAEQMRTKQQNGR